MYTVTARVLHQPHSAMQATGFSKMASYAAPHSGQPSPEWLAREDRRILPHLFQKLQIGISHGTDTSQS